MYDFLNAVVLLLNFVIIPATTYGSQLALGALGITFIYAILRFANFSHGELMSFGTMMCIFLTWLFQSYGIKIGILPTAIIALPFAIIATIIFALAINNFVFNYYRFQKSPPVVIAMASIGVMFVVNAIIRIFIGPQDRNFFDGQRFLIKAKQFKNFTGLDEGLALKSTQVLTVFITIILLAFVFWFLPFEILTTINNTKIIAEFGIDYDKPIYCSTKQIIIKIGLSPKTNDQQIIDLLPTTLP